MAVRPIFIPRIDGSRLVDEVHVNFTWNPGFAPVQKQKNIRALHEAAKHHGFSSLLEVSTKSEDDLGQSLSAFNLFVEDRELGRIPLECAFQSSKVFADGGPFLDLRRASPRDARRDIRLRESGSLVGFQYDGIDWGLEPKTAFYDWLYLQCAVQKISQIKSILDFEAFTDIEFNPTKSINCQARSCALLAALVKKGLLEQALSSVSGFVRLVRFDSSKQPHSRSGKQEKLF